MRAQRSFKPLCSGGNESQQLYICIVQQLKFIRFYTCVRWILFRFPYWVCIPTTAATAGSAVATAILHNKVSSECWSPDGWIHIHTYMHMYWLVLDWIAGGARRLPEKPTTVLPQKQNKNQKRCWKHSRSLNAELEPRLCDIKAKSDAKATWNGCARPRKVRLCWQG